MEEVRDYELTKLRLWEEYQVKRIETEYNEDILKAKQNHNRMIKLIKEKLYDKLEKQIQQLKDDKLLLNLVNANSWKGTEKGLNGTLASHLSASEISISLHERRSLRKREVSLRFTAGEADDLSDDGRLSGSSGYIGNGYFSATGGQQSGGAGGYSSSSKRRRHYATRYSSNDESSSAVKYGGRNGASNGGGDAGSGGGNGGASSASGYTSHGGAHYHHGVSSGNDSNLSDKDYDTLNNIIMGNEDGGASLVLLDKANGGMSESNSAHGVGQSSGKASTRSSHKQFTGLSGLKPEELNDDLSLIRNAIKK